jgi:PPK2 family polyphosphate:nucleotide phosphotransferase
MTSSPYLVRPGKELHLGRIRTDDTGPFKSKQQAELPTQANCRRLAELQRILYAQARHAVLIVLQGMDGSGKDGAIAHVFGSVNPQSCFVTSFKAPSPDELAHDYLWRIHQHTPRLGTITIFNRSHYESVLVERVRGIVPKSVWSRRYEHINAFERMLADEGTTILKFFLHISKEQQKQRLEIRLKDPTKNWKFDPSDLDTRRLWDEYQAAYQDALPQCSTEYAPWYVVPSDRKWFRNWVISDTIVRALEGLKLKYPPAIKGIERFQVE